LSVAVLTGRTALGAWLDDRRAGGATIGLVPTMGALHAGHLSLIRRAAADCDAVVVSVYVNPLQFSPAEDLAAYPRDLDADTELAGEAGADVVFAPSVEEMWPEPAMTTVHVDGVSAPLEGHSRPGHFDGVATIVAKLLGLAGPCTAYFGEKDFQQLAVIRRMAADLSLPVAVVGCPVVREPDGLALSSRNAYLTPDERALAPRVYWSLLAGRRVIEDDRRSEPEAVVAAMEASVAEVPELTLDYAAVVDPVTLTTPARLAGEVRLLVAARLGRARLIDNLGAVVADPTGS
jgi:pantoate--beta-alanine ligase